MFALTVGSGVFSFKKFQTKNTGNEIDHTKGPVCRAGL